jgi:hypothetical protein
MGQRLSGGWTVISSPSTQRRIRFGWQVDSKPVSIPAMDICIRNSWLLEFLASLSAAEHPRQKPFFSLGNKP